MNDSKTWLEQTSSRARALSEAYQSQLGRLWWVNLMFVVLPAVLSTAAAIFAALPKEQNFSFYNLPAASAFAGVAVVLMAVHKALKCEEYQTECLRLSQAYQSIAIAADSAWSGPDGERDSQQKSLTSELIGLTKNAKAQVPTNFMK